MYYKSAHTGHVQERNEINKLVQCRHFNTL